MNFRPNTHILIAFIVPLMSEIMLNSCVIPSSSVFSRATCRQHSRTTFLHFRVRLSPFREGLVCCMPSVFPFCRLYPYRI